MQVPVLVEPVAGNGFRAKGAEPFGLITLGATREEALQKLRADIQSRLAHGAEVRLLDVPTANDPWQRLEGIYKDEPLFDEWQQAIAEYREQVDREVFGQ